MLHRRTSQIERHVLLARTLGFVGVTVALQWVVIAIRSDAFGPLLQVPVDENPADRVVPERLSQADDRAVVASHGCCGNGEHGVETEASFRDFREVARSVSTVDEKERTPKTQCSR